MAAEIPDIEPTEVIAGDTIAWNKDVDDFPAGTWTLSYYLRGPSNINITATQSGSSRIHAVSVSGTTSATWPEGSYKWQAFVTSGAERYKVGEGDITINENPATSNVTFDNRTINKQILDALEASMFRRAGREEKGYQIEAAGRSFTFHTHEELIMAIEKFRGFVAQEEEAAKVARGENTGKNILVRFL